MVLDTLVFLSCMWGWRGLIKPGGRALVYEALSEQLSPQYKIQIKWVLPWASFVLTTRNHRNSLLHHQCPLIRMMSGMGKP